MALTNVWHRYNLRQSPFFQESLALLDRRTYPVDLFVARSGEAERMLRVIGGSGTSRQIVQGRPGVGKTTLVQYIKARANTEGGMLSDTSAVNVGQVEDADTLALRILDYVCRTLIANNAPEDDALNEARQFVHISRLQEYSGGVTVAAFGVQGGRTTHTTMPPAVRAGMFIGEMLQRLMRLAREGLHASGIIVHLNNLENISEGDAEHAGRVLRDLRDPCLFADGYHWIVTGTTEAITGSIRRFEQLRSVFGIAPVLAPLSPVEVNRLLEKRYAHMRYDKKLDVTLPVTSETVNRLYQLFQGDLRGTLRALEEATNDLLGFGEAGVAASLQLNEVMGVLGPRYRTEMQSTLSVTAAKYLARSAKRDLDRTVTQRQLAREWRVKSGAVSKTLSDLMRHGYLTNTGRLGSSKRGRPESQYAFTGSAKLVFGSHIVDLL